MKLKRGLNYLRRNGLKGTLERIYNGKNGFDRLYNDWFLKHRVTRAELEDQIYTTFNYQPLISILVPTYNTPINLLDEMIDSIIHQSYANWELCIAEASIDNQELRKHLERYDDERIKVKLLDTNGGIALNTNEALKMAQGEYITLVDHDDFLELDALFEVVKVLQKERYDIIYTDEDKYNQKTKKYEDPNFKPDFNPDLLMGSNYITHLFVVKRDIANRIGGQRKEFDGSQDHDFILRCTEESKNIYHIRKPLYHWRMVENSTALDPESKMYAYIAGQKAVQAHLDRQNIKATVEMMPAPYWGLYHPIFEIDGEPLVSIIISNTHDRKDLDRCITSILDSSYKNVEITVVTKSNLTGLPSSVRIIKGNEDYLENVNKGLVNASGNYFLLLKDTMELENKDSIKEMVSMFVRGEVGAVGPKISDTKGKVVSAGYVYDGEVKSLFKGWSKDAVGYMMRLFVSGDYSGLSFDCLMIKDKQIIDKYLFNRIRQNNKLVVYNAHTSWIDHKPEEINLPDITHERYFTPSLEIRDNKLKLR